MASISGYFTMDVAYMRFSTAAPATFITTVSAMLDQSVTNGDCEDQHGPKAEDRRPEGTCVYVCLWVLVCMCACVCVYVAAR